MAKIIRGQKTERIITHVKQNANGKKYTHVKKYGAMAFHRGSTQSLN